MPLHGYTLNLHKERGLGLGAHNMAFAILLLKSLKKTLELDFYEFSVLVQKYSSPGIVHWLHEKHTIYL